jgi:hypothetical protein
MLALVLVVLFLALFLVALVARFLARNRVLLLALHRLLRLVMLVM